MHTVSRATGPALKRGRVIQLRLTRAYRSVLLKDEESQIVLADLAEASGYYQVSPPLATGEQRAFADGMREVFSRILGRLRMTDAELVALEEAAREEALLTARETQ